MNQFEQAAIDDCALKCAKEINKVFKLIKPVTPTLKQMLQKEIDQTIAMQVRKLENGRI